jgi:hypothetical protein
LNSSRDITPSPFVSNFFTICLSSTSLNFSPKAYVTFRSSGSSILPLLSRSKLLKIC